MPKFRIVITETIIVTYPAVEIEAESEEAATDIAENMRCDGLIADATEACTDVDYETEVV